MYHYTTIKTAQMRLNLAGALNCLGRKVKQFRERHTGSKIAGAQACLELRRLRARWAVVGLPRIELGLHPPHGRVLPVYYSPAS